ncbi:MAG: GlxA family transcriptional regulator [Herbaspirillum sp.]|nr:GlxA family transcriptional regulator [Herbaspirillum sp.]
MHVFPSIQVGVVQYPGSSLSAIHGLGDLFAFANRFAAEQQGNGGPFIRVSHWRSKASGKAPVRVDENASDTGSTEQLTVVILPPRLGEQITRAEALPYLDWLRENHGNGTLLSSVCGGAFLLAETGLLAGRPVTTHWAHAELFRHRFPDVQLDTDKLVIDDGDIISAGGVMAWVDLGLWLVNRFFGETVMGQTAHFMLADPPAREQRFYSTFSPNLMHGDAAVLKVQEWIRSTGAKEVTISALAELAGLEERTFLRRFRKATNFTAVDYCQRLRVDKARELLQFTIQPIETIAWEVGYTDTGAFRKIFTRITGLSPGEYRQRFNVGRKPASLPAHRGS